MIDFRTQAVGSLARLVRSGQVTAHDLVTHSLERIAALDGALRAFVAVDAASALAAARRVDDAVSAGLDPGPLAGVPIAVKDLEDAAGFVTTFGSHVLAGDQPAEADSVLVSRLKSAGAVVVGKTNTPELGWKGTTDNPRFGATANPWSLAHSPGGSSGGSVAAVAAGMVPLATGSDGGGSIRIPSAWCGITGFKPSLGRIPVSGPGLSVSWHQLSCKGIIANTISDILAGFAVAAGPDPGDLNSLPRTGDWDLASAGGPGWTPRIAWSPTLGHAILDPSVDEVCRAAVSRLRAGGLGVKEVPAVFSRDAAGAWHILTGVYNLQAIGHLRGTPAWDRLDPELARSAEDAGSISGVELAKAEGECDRLNSELAVLFRDFDLLVTPTCATPPPALGDPALHGSRLDLRRFPFTYPFNMTRSPAATVCVGFDRAGFPVGLQIVGPMHADMKVMQAAAAFEVIFSSARRLAPLPAPTPHRPPATGRSSR